MLNSRRIWICEAARWDGIWGIGMEEGAAVAMWHALGMRAVESWGLNLLGKAIMGVRERIEREIERDRGETKEEMSGEKVKSEREKKIRGLNKRLRDIEALKEKKDKGKMLQPNQVEKIGKEGHLRRELEELGSDEAA